MRKINGLTLVELLIASSIFAIIMASIYSAFYGGFLGYRKMDASFEVYQSARTIFSRIESDLRNSFLYTQDDSKFHGSDANMDFFSIKDAFTKDDIFTDICKIKYEKSDNKIKRTYYRGLEALKDDAAVEPQILAPEIKEVSFEYAYFTGNPDKPYEWQASWPKCKEQTAALPLAVKIKLSLNFPDKDKKSDAKPVEFSRVVALPLSKSAACKP